MARRRPARKSPRSSAESAKERKWSLATISTLVGIAVGATGLVMTVRKCQEERKQKAATLTFDTHLAGDPPLGLLVKNVGPGRAQMRSMTIGVEGRLDGNQDMQVAWQNVRLELGLPHSRLAHGWFDPGGVLIAHQTKALLFGAPELFEPAFRDTFELALKRLSLAICYCDDNGDCRVASKGPQLKGGRECSE